MHRPLRLVFGFFLLAALVGVLNLPVWACSCKESTVDEQLGRSDVVFVGKVVGAKTQESVVDEAGNSVTYDVDEIYLEVEEAFRGAKIGERITIHSYIRACGVWFLRGKRYLVYATEDSSGSFWTSICHRTSMFYQSENPNRLGTAETDLTELRRVFREKPNASVLGRCDTDPNSRPGNLNFAGVRILLKNDQTGEIRETRVDAEGKFQFSTVPAGMYTLMADISSQKYEQQLFRGRNGKVLVFDRGCVVVLLTVKAKSP
jgi:Tissue inhibitor of metalloproteinase